MPEIVNAQLTDHCNVTLRTIGDKLTELLILVQTARDDYELRGLGTIINNAGSSNLITDGSTEDGRTRVAGGDVFNLHTFLSKFLDFVDDPEFPGRRDVIAKWNVNGHKG